MALGHSLQSAKQMRRLQDAVAAAGGPGPAPGGGTLTRSSSTVENPAESVIGAAWGELTNAPFGPDSQSDVQRAVRPCQAFGYGVRWEEGG